MALGLVLGFAVPAAAVDPGVVIHLECTDIAIGALPCVCPVRDSWCKLIDCLIKRVREAVVVVIGTTNDLIVVAACSVPSEPPV
jgi:hypothetical protein